MRNASIVLDCSFGDGGKGLVVDNLCHRHRAAPDTWGNVAGIKPLVVRFSGGQQCGHTVIRDGTKHVFSSFGSGTLYGCETFFTEDTTFYIPNLIREYDILASKNVTPVLHIHPFAMVTTPYDVAANRMLERSQLHGSCGMGVGQTMKRNFESPYKLYAIDLLYPEIFYEKLKNIYKYFCIKCDVDSYVNAELWVLERDFDSAYEKWRADNKYFSVQEPILRYKQSVVFEGSQGIMLDMDHGVFPNVTFASTTAKNAFKYFEKWNISNLDRYYVTRCYTTRHGNGWMPNESPIKLINNEQEINVFNEWQKDFRVGEFDYPMIKHAIQIDQQYYSIMRHSLNTRQHLVVTCLDQRPDFMLDKTQFSNMIVHTNNSPEAGNMQQLMLK